MKPLMETVMGIRLNTADVSPEQHWPLVNGRNSAGHGAVLEDRDPYDGSLFATVHLADAGEIKAAIEASVAAQRGWWALGAGARERALMEVAALIEGRRPQLVDILVREGGSTVGKAEFEVGVAAEMVRGAAGECRRVNGETIPSDTPNLLSMTIRQPLGVVAAILPFNFPLLLGAKKIAFAVAAGNGVVVKPSPHSPVAGLALGAIFRDAGVPPGLVNVVPSDAVTFADLVVEHPSVAMITFTGSSAVGRELAGKAGRNLKRIALELGGKSPMIVLADADLDYAVQAACFGIMHHQGQVCMANSRVIVETAIYDAFVARLGDKLGTLKVGDPSDSGTVIGPLIDATKLNGLRQQLADAVSNGARIVCGGEAVGSALQPTLVADVTPAARLFDEECFAPVVTVSCALDHHHALELANRSSFGLSSAVLTNDLQKALELADGLQAGMVHINDSSIYDEPQAPFGGVKASGMGREGGRYSIEAMTELKWITIARKPRHFPF
jgi:aldehyde dehydrogenase (NAD+)